MTDAKQSTPYRFAASMRTNDELEYAKRLEARIAASPFSQVERMMNFPLYTPRQSIANFLIKYEIFKQVLNVHGSVVECGVLFGGGLFTFAQLSAIFEPTNHQRRVIGFDTFSGFPAIASQDSGGSAEAHPGGLAIDSYEELTRCIELFDANRFVGHVPKVELVRGDARTTIPDYIARNDHLVVSLLYLDFDVYEPTRIALENFLPRMPKGAIVAFDELNVKSWPGETRALLEVRGIKDLAIERFTFGSTISFAKLC